MEYVKCIDQFGKSSYLNTYKPSSTQTQYLSVYLSIHLSTYLSPFFGPACVCACVIFLLSI